jgi:taurine dioxygenase
VTIRIQPLPTIGAEVIGLDLDQPVDGDTAARLREEWYKAGVLVFRGIGTSAEGLLDLSRVFGELEPHPIEHIRMADYPELIELTNRDGPKGPVYAYDGVPTYGRIPWHTDLAFQPVPNAGALLNMVHRAEQGGMTAWLDTTKAYASLSDDLKQRLEGLEARFEFCADLSRMRFRNPGGTRVGQSAIKFPDYPALARPIVTRHPHTGDVVMNVCPLNIRGIVGMDQDASDALINELIDAVVQPQFVYEHDWATNDIVLWDNYRMMHAASGHPLDVLRIARRSTLRGGATMGRVLAAETAGAAA